jgi:N-acetylglucosaminyl-diphospho-decaprenol L-rhamnosyltransferase
VPYTEHDDENTTCCTPASTAASSRWTVPSTLLWKYFDGRCIDSPTFLYAAKCTIVSTSCSRQTDVTSPSSAMSPTTSGASMTASALPSSSESSTTTGRPSARMARTVWEPMYPAPPVTRMVRVTAGQCTVPPMIAAVIVTHTAPAEVVVACVRSVVSAGGAASIVVVHNGSDQGREALSGAFDSADLGDRISIVQTANRGYGAAANVGAARAIELGATAVALLNDDVTVRPGWLAPLASALDEPGVGAAQPKLLVAGSDPPVVNSLGVAIDRYGAGFDIGDGSIDSDGSGTVTIEAFTAGAVLLSVAFLRATGGFDERWFLYYEDLDLSARGRALGWRYVVVHDSVVDHARGLSTGADGGRTRYLQERNRIRHAFRHLGAATILRALWLSVRRLRHEPRSVHARALAAGLPARRSRSGTEPARDTRAGLMRRDQARSEAANSRCAGLTVSRPARSWWLTPCCRRSSTIGGR